MSRKLKYDPNLYGEGKGGTFDVREGQSGFIMSNSRIGTIGIMAACVWCKKDFDYWSSDRVNLIAMLKESGWKRTRSRHWKCPECQKFNVAPATIENARTSNSN